MVKWGESGWTIAIVLLMGALAHGQPIARTCTYGQLFTESSWLSPRISVLQRPCGEILLYDAKKVIPGKRGTIEVLQETTYYNVPLKTGERFRYSNDTGEGQCKVWIRNLKPLELDCPWLPGFTADVSSTYRIISPPGNQEWYHLVSDDGKAIGWYLMNNSMMDPTVQIQSNTH